MKVAVMCANFGSFDVEKIFPAQSQKCDFYYRNETNMDYPMTALDNRMKAKYYKLQAHKIFTGYDIYIWLDGAFQIKSPAFVSHMIYELVNNDICVTKHPERNCIYTEAEFVLQGLIKQHPYFTKRYARSQLNVERNYYEHIAYPADNGLYACGLFARWGNEKMNSFFDKWWDACLKWSVFDQLSFPVLAMQNSIKINPLVFENYIDNKFYQIVKHQQR